jgi:UV DNA damage repair endonuclease
VNLSRIGQSLIHLASHPSLPYDWEAERGDELREIGGPARSPNSRLSMHPGQFFQPGSVWPVEDTGQSACSLTVPAITDVFHRGLNRYT